MMPQVAAAAAVTVSRLDQFAQPLRNMPTTIQASNFRLFIVLLHFGYTKHNFNIWWIAKQYEFKIFFKFSNQEKP
jgi:hypothetical protein